jgi:hypothetical protein
MRYIPICRSHETNETQHGLILVISIVGNICLARGREIPALTFDFRALSFRASAAQSLEDVMVANAINRFLIEEFGTELEQVIREASAGKNLSIRSPRVACTAQCLKQRRKQNGGISELYGGLLTLDGARYWWRAEIGTEAEEGRAVGAVQLGPMATAPAAAL